MLMDLYVFSSSNLTNIWAGVGARMWAVSPAQAKNVSIRGKAKNLPRGACGIFYCVENKVLTTPFVVKSTPDQHQVVSDIWPENWELPFKIVPLGTPDQSILVATLGSRLPSLKRPGRGWNQVFHVSPITIFAPSRITTGDWEILIDELVEV